MIKNLDDLCDEEISFEEWLGENGYAVFLDVNKQLKDVFKTIYMQGYAAGYMNKQRQNAREQLQK